MNNTSQMRCNNGDVLHYSASCTKVVNPKNQRNMVFRVSVSQSSRERLQPTCPSPNKLGQINKEELGAWGGRITAISSTRAILLQTATAIATNEDGSWSLPVRTLFDNGSQWSYVPDNHKSKLCLKPMSSGTHHLHLEKMSTKRRDVTLPFQNKQNELKKKKREIYIRFSFVHLKFSMHRQYASEQTCWQNRFKNC